MATITGTVTDEAGAPLPGVSIVIKGTTSGVITNLEGEFTIEVESTAVLVFSFVGMTTQEIPAAGKTQINVTLAEEAIGLEEVVVIGYGTKTRKDLTGSIAVVDVDELQKMPARSAQQALQGMAAGVDITLSGVPGKAPKIYIRGVTSFGNTNPLVIVDGIEQSINNIDALDIETIQVLKDAGAAAIYGVRGSNGVILVTTKKGKVGKPVITYEGNFGMTYPLQGDPWNILNIFSKFLLSNKLNTLPGRGYVIP